MDIRRIEPIVVKGSLGIFEWSVKAEDIDIHPGVNES